MVRKKWDSAIRGLHLFLRSEKPVSDKIFRVKCSVCEKKNTSCEADYAGTTNLAYHAKNFHSYIEQVKDWIPDKGKKDEKCWEARASQNSSLIQVCLGMTELASFRL